jgi:hypothetical protein
VLVRKPSTTIDTSPLRVDVGPRMPGFHCALVLGPKPPPTFSYTAGICTRCKGTCTTQMVRMTDGKADALCATCLGRERESKAADWFAAEERARR